MQNRQTPLPLLIMLSLILGMPVVMSACTFGQNHSARMQEAAVEESAERAEENELNQDTRVPPPLQTVSERAEDIYDSAKAHDWNRSDSLLTKLQQAHQQMKSKVTAQAQEKAGLDTAVASLSKGVEEKNPMVAMDAANQVTLHTSRMLSLYKPTMPTELTKLDYLGREMQLATMYGKKARLDSAKQDIRKTWSILKPVVLAHGGTPQASRFDKLVANIAEVKTMPEIAQFLDEVDHLETVFQ